MSNYPSQQWGAQHAPGCPLCYCLVSLQEVARLDILKREARRNSQLEEAVMKYLFVVFFLVLSPVMGRGQDGDPFMKKALARQPLFDAIEAGDKGEVLKLLQKRQHVDLNHRELWLGETYLIEAIRAGQAAIVSILLGKGADPNLREIIGVDAHDELILGSSPLECAVAQGSQEIVRLLIKHGIRLRKNEDILHSTKSIGMVRLLLDNGAPINGLDQHGATYLQRVAAQRDLQDIAKLLIEKGAKVNVVDSGGRTPLHVVATAELAQLLIKKGAQVNVADSEGLTPLHLATFANQIDLTRLLIASGVNVNARNKFGYSSLDFMVADWYGNYELARLLVAHGAVINESLVQHYGLVEVFEKIKRELAEERAGPSTAPPH